MNNLKTSMGKQIKILAEVEKIWILYDLDSNGSLSFDEIKVYLQEMSHSKALTEQDLKSLFSDIDTNNDNQINKAEMSSFIENCMDNDKNFGIYSISEL